MKRDHVNLTALTLVLAATTACLQKDVTETWYVDGDGKVTWVVHEENVRSDSQAPVDRMREENEYWLAVQQERHPMMAGLRELGGEKLRTRVLRADVPFTIQTEAKFAGLDVLGQRLIAAVGTTGTSIVRRTSDGAWEWTLVVRDPSALGATFEPSDGITELLDSLEHLKVVLVNGRFEAAEGFSMSNDRRVATFSYKEQEQNTSNEPAVALKLVWR